MRRWVAASAIASGCLAVVNAPPAHALTSSVCPKVLGESVLLFGDPATETFVFYQQVTPVEARICFNLPDKDGRPNAGVLVLRGGSFNPGGVLTEQPTGCAVPIPVIIIAGQEIRLSIELSATSSPAVCVALNGAGIKLTYIAPSITTPPGVELWLDPGIRVFPS